MRWTNTITTLTLHKRGMTPPSLSSSCVCNTALILSSFQMEVFALLNRGAGAQAMNPDPPIYPKTNLLYHMLWRKLSVPLLQRARRWFHHLLISQSWPVEIAQNLNELPDATMAEEGSCGDGGGGVRRALTCENSSWATSLSQGGQHVSLGHPDSSRDVSILMRRRELTC